MVSHVLIFVRSGFRSPFSLLLDEVGNEAGPAGLVARAYTSAVVAIKVLVERNVVAPVWIMLEGLLIAEHRPPPVSVPRKDADQALRERGGYLVQRQIL